MPTSRIANDRRVQAVDPNSGRCLIENCSPNRSVQYWHVIPRRYWQKGSLLDSLEWYWGMRKNTLNLETRRNIFPAGSSIHRMYDAGLWIMVPEESIVQTYRDALIEDPLRADRESFPLIPNRNNFEYRLLPLKGMDNIVLMRQNDPSAPLVPGAVTIHYSPFNTFPTFVSHVHPKFVIMSAGFQLFVMQTTTRSAFDALKETYPIVVMILELFLAWHGPVPPNAESNPTYYPPYNPDADNDDDEGNGGNDPEDKDYDNAVTEKGRYLSRKRSRQESPTPNRPRTRNQALAHDDSGNLSQASKRKRSANLSRASVSEHTRKMGKLEWNKDALMNWSSNCQPPMLAEVADLPMVSTGKAMCVQMEGSGVC